MKSSAIKTIAIINEQDIKNMVYEIRGQKVMLDFDLARIYGYETRYFNRQVQNNADRFPSTFRFKLSKEEAETILMCKNFTSSWGGTRKLPYAFTEHGVYMLMTVLKGELAVKQSIALIKAFKALKDSALAMGMAMPNDLIPIRLGALEEKVESQGKEIAGVREELSAIVGQFSEESQKEGLFLDGQRVKASLAYRDIYAQAKKNVLVLDDYVGPATLEYLEACRPGVVITLFSDNASKPGIGPTDIENFKEDTKGECPLAIIPTHRKLHDRFILLDYGLPKERAFHCGCSSKDAGRAVAMMMEIGDPAVLHPVVESLLRKDYNPQEEKERNMRDLKKEEEHLLDLEEAGLSREQLSESLAADFIEGDIDRPALDGLIPYFGGDLFEGLSELEDKALKEELRKRLG